MSPRVSELLEMLRFKRPSGSPTESVFVQRFIASIPGATADACGNYWVKVGDDSPILWSSHFDTVHRTDGLQRLTYGHGVVTTDGSHNECLGADCTTGVWLMRQMILKAVPGLYVFHYGEEVGGIGSAHIAKHTPNRLEDIKFAIAFDRKGTTEIITHQGWQRTASDEFAESLAEALGLSLTASDQGTFTDTANYTGLVSECTNLAVGYYSQHSVHEYQDVHFACRLLDAILKADFSKLVAVRDPAEEGWDDWLGSNRYTSNRIYERDQWPEDDATSVSLANYVKQNPTAVADYLEALGIGIKDIEDGLYGSDAPPWHRY